MEQRKLDFKDLAEVLAEVHRLHTNGYRKLGQWDLAQVCNHLAYFIQGSLDGFTFRVPWLLKVLFGRFTLRRILEQRRMNAGGPTPQKPLPEPGGDEDAAVANLEQTGEKFQAHAGDLHASPFFGYLTRQQWLAMHLVHCAHHLGFLAPRVGAA
jgi:hypothetical protein